MSLEIGRGEGPGFNTSSLRGKTGEHRTTEKAASIQLELQTKLRDLFEQLPQHSKIILAREIREAHDNPEEAIKRLEREIAVREIARDHLKYSGDAKRALEELQTEIPEPKIQ